MSSLRLCVKISSLWKISSRRGAEFFSFPEKNEEQVSGESLKQRINEVTEDSDRGTQVSHLRQPQQQWHPCHPRVRHPRTTSVSSNPLRETSSLWKISSRRGAEFFPFPEKNEEQVSGESLKQRINEVTEDSDRGTQVSHLRQPQQQRHPCHPRVRHPRTTSVSSNPLRETSSLWKTSSLRLCVR